ncbi:NEDD4-binding protein 2-like 1 [Alosa sapidissima]|uniref:NEDD4-binding protein 2-like 1 n=1 Tax=Alosa sapidissima TaxID=34773 RepID=UPI001C0A0A98|nr:NEDD4-binding protein 2-like 1 [Alosa sapidissima]
MKRNRGTIYILRGLPYTGRPGKARNVWQDGGEIISYFDYFRIYHNSQIIPKYLHKAHMWARREALENIERGVDPVIINNPNMPLWHMYPYVRMAFFRGYWIEFIETEDTWDVPLEELERRGGGKIPLPILEDMKESYEPVRHVFDVLCDEYSQYRWIGSKEMTSNDW